RQSPRDHARRSPCRRASCWPSRCGSPSASTGPASPRRGTRYRPDGRESREFAGCREQPPLKKNSGEGEIGGSDARVRTGDFTSAIGDLTLVNSTQDTRDASLLFRNIEYTTQAFVMTTQTTHAKMAASARSSGKVINSTRIPARVFEFSDEV